MAAFAQVINVGVNDHGPPDNASLSVKSNQFVGDVQLGNTVSTSSDVAKISGVTSTLGVGRGSVLGSIGIVVGSSTRAAVSVVAKLVNVKSMFPRCQATDFTGYFNGVLLNQGRKNGQNKFEKSLVKCHVITPS